MEEKFSTEKLAEKQDINEIIKPYISKWYWFVIFIFLGVVVAYFVLKFQTTVYRVESKVLIKDAEDNKMKDFDFLSGFGGMQTSSVDNEIEIFKSKTLLKKIVQEKKMQVKVFGKKIFGEKELYGNTSPFIVKVLREVPYQNFPTIPVEVSFKNDEISIASEELKSTIKGKISKPIQLPYATILVEKNPNYISKLNHDLSDHQTFLFQIMSEDGAVNDIQRQISVDYVNEDATVLSISMNHSAVEKAQDIINSLIFFYNQDAIEDKSEEDKKTIAFIDDRISKLVVELGNVEADKENFKTINQLTDIQTEARINLESNAQNRGKELEAEAQLELTNALIQYMKKQGRYQVLPSNIGLSDSELSAGISAYNRLVLERNRLLASATEENPAVVDLSKQIDAMRNSVSQSLDRNRVALQISKSELSAEQGKLKNRISKFPSMEKEFRGIERQQQIKESLYLLLLQKREETAIRQSVKADKAKILDKANLASDIPVAPKRMYFLLGGVLLGMVLPFGFIYVQDLFNNKIKTKSDVERLSSLPVLGELPVVKTASKDLIGKNDLSSVAEAFRILTTNLNFMVSKNQKGNVIFVSSTIKGEGKTFTSVNLALTLANSGKKTIVIGTDIRNPQLQRYDKNSHLYKGVTEFLHSSDLEMEQIVKNFKDTSLDVIYSGIIPPNPAELFMNGRFDRLISELKLHYDYIIVDTAPLLLVTDTLLIIDNANVLLYVTRSNYTEKNLISFINEKVREGKVKNVGLVINDVKNMNLSYGKKNGYGYHREKEGFLSKFKKIFS